MRSIVRRGRCSLAILRWRHGRQLLNEGNDRPNAVVVVGRAEGRHASHSNTVFDDPEQFRGSPGRGSETIKSNHNPSFIVITKSTAEFLLMQVGTCVFAMCVDCSLKCSSWSLLALRKL